MRRLIFAAAVALSSLSAFQLSALDYDSYCRNRYGWNVASEVAVSAGYRQDNIHWTIAGSGGFPNILSELKWEDIGIMQWKGEVRWLVCRHLYVRGSAAYGRIFNGHGSDSDYNGDGKTQEFSRSTSVSNKGEVFDFSGGIGWLFDITGPEWVMGPVIGFSYSEQHLRDRRGKQVIGANVSDLYGTETLGEPLGHFPGLHSNYRTRWQGPWFGIDANYAVCDNWDLYATGEYHLIWYQGTGHWNLRTDYIKDFLQKAHGGHGYVASLSSRYRFWRWWGIGLTGSYTWMKTGTGKDRTYFADGEQKVRFNGCTWHSWNVLFDLIYEF